MLLVMPLITKTDGMKILGSLDASVSYVFFYALPLCLLLLFMFPFFKYGITMRCAVHLIQQNAAHDLVPDRNLYFFQRRTDTTACIDDMSVCNCIPINKTSFI